MASSRCEDKGAVASRGEFVKLEDENLPEGWVKKVKLWSRFFYLKNSAGLPT